MQPIIDLYKQSETLHHAYFFVSAKVDETVSKIKHFFEHVVGIKTSSNPDFQHLKFDTLTIDGARSITEHENRKNFSGGNPLTNSGPRKVFIIEADFITEEAQNSLLKVFEEPTVGTHFFIVSPQDILLPTLRSRMQTILIGNDSVGSESILKKSLKDRLAMVKEITEAISDEEKTKQDAIAFLNQIETELYESGSENKSKSLEICELARASLYDRGAPVKMILENVLLSI